MTPAVAFKPPFTIRNELSSRQRRDETLYSIVADATRFQFGFTIPVLKGDLDTQRNNVAQIKRQQTMQLVYNSPSKY